MKKIKLLCILLTFVMLISSTNLSVLAAENVTLGKNTVTYQTTKAERDAYFNAIIANQITPKGSAYKYRTDYLPYQYKVISGYAGNQLAGGYNISTGGSLYYVDSGGPSIDFSVSVSLPAPYNFISLSAGLGQKSNGVTGYIVNLPADNNFYKIYVTKTVEIRPYVTYRAKTGTDNWEVWVSNAVPVTYKISLKRVKV